MQFNTFGTRLIISAVLSLPSYTFLFLIRGYEFSRMTLYAHVEYSGVVFLILISLFEIHTLKSRRLEELFPWKGNIRPRVFAECTATLLFTPIVVTLFVFILYRLLWGTQLWWPGVFEYNLFALTVSFVFAAFVNVDVIIDEWKSSLVRNERLEKENIKSRLYRLQDQVSPHFLFNNFNVLSALIEEDSSLARTYLEKLSDIYRYVLNRKDDELVSLNEEMQFIRDYLFLMKIRFDDKITCNIDINGSGNAKIPPATLQILVENAIKHNEISSRHPLQIQIRQLHHDLLEIHNKRTPKRGTSKGAGVGLDNIRDRYRYLTDRSVTITETEDSFTVTVPLLTY